MLLTAASSSWAIWGDVPDPKEIYQYDRVSIVFAVQNLKSPVSQFGHSFLVFHREDDPEPSALTIEFAGHIAATKDYFLTLTGRAHGRFQFSYLSYKARSYDLEDRSLWIYELSLSRDEVERLAAAFVDQSQQQFGYGVFRKNCASYIVEEVARIRGLHYKSESVFFITPDATVRWLRNEKLIKSSHYRPSQQLRALAAYDSLSSESKGRIHHLLEGYGLDGASATNPERNALGEIIDYEIVREPDGDRRNALFNLKKTYFETRDDVQIPPDPSRGAGAATISMLFEATGDGTVFSYRPGFIGLENESGYGFKNASSEVGRLDVRFANSSTSVDRFNLINMESHSPDGFLLSPFTQKLSIAYANYRPYLDRTQRETAIEFGRGMTYVVAKQSLSILPFLSLKAIDQAHADSVELRIACRLHLYGDLGAGWHYAANYDRFFDPGLGITAYTNLELQFPKFRLFGLSLNLSDANSLSKGVTAGVRAYATF